MTLPIDDKDLLLVMSNYEAIYLKIPGKSDEMRTHALMQTVVTINLKYTPQSTPVEDNAIAASRNVAHTYRAGIAFATRGLPTAAGFLYRYSRTLFAYCFLHAC